MTAAEYRTALDRLGLTQAEAAEVLGVTLRTSQNYARHGCDGPAKKLLEKLLAETY